jgi:hypothetical protein
MSENGACPQMAISTEIMNNYFWVFTIINQGSWEYLEVPGFQTNPTCRRKTALAVRPTQGIGWPIVQARTAPYAGSQSTRLTKDLNLETMWLSLDKSVSCDQGELEFSSSEEDANQWHGQCAKCILLPCTNQNNHVSAEVQNWIT